MGITKTLGGDRLGAGNRMKQEMHDFYRSNKNLSTRFASSMAPGVLYPSYVNIGLKGDTFDIDINAFVRTIPTIGPLYGSFKLQIDVFQVPFRLYQGILHNNTTDIARKMNQVYLPKVELPAYVDTVNEPVFGYKEQIHYSALMRYLYQSGVIATEKGRTDSEKALVKRKICAIPMLAYYDIFKNYYANKQEENAYVIESAQKELNMSINRIYANTQKGTNVSVDNQTITGGEYSFELSTSNTTEKIKSIVINGSNLAMDSIRISASDTTGSSGPGFTGNVKQFYDTFCQKKNQDSQAINLFVTDKYLIWNSITIEADWQNYKSVIQLQPFALRNIDIMRKYLLTQWNLGTEVVISENNQNYLPYNIQTKVYPNKTTGISYPMAGLCVKTYQSDMFNNWLDTEWVNEITETSAIDVSNGSFTLDMLNFKKKLYDHLNRLAISGGTYDDWQEATYGDKVWGKSEKPIYCGGMSSEIEFDEVVSTTQGEGNGYIEENNKLGSIAGRGNLAGRKGGHITIKVGEASVIIAIASITPRLMYSQGNAWFNTELNTMDDLHKPIFDRIGFQDLMVEQMAWWDAKRIFGTGLQEGKLDPNTIQRTSAGKQPAWMQYATDVDRVFGDFANNKIGGLNYMVLTRNYEQDQNGNVADVTTYIDPQKFNYAFAYQELDAQNFWTFIGMKIIARRKMSNTQIPNV